MKNKYSQRAKISEEQVLELVRLFAFDLTVSQIAALLHLNRNTVGRYVTALRRRIAESSGYGRDIDVRPATLQVEQIRGVKGRNPSDNNALILIFFHDQKVCSSLVPRHLTALIQAVTRGKVRADGVLEALAIKNCIAIGNLHTKQLSHLPVQPANGEDADRSQLVPTVNRFWMELKQRMLKFRGLRREVLPLHLSECEFRFNNRHDIYQHLLKLIDNKPLF